MYDRAGLGFSDRAYQVSGGGVFGGRREGVVILMVILEHIRIC